MNVNPNKRLPIIAYSTRLDAMLIIDHKKSTDVRWYGAPISYLRYVKRRLNDYNKGWYVKSYHDKSNFDRLIYNIKELDSQNL